MIHYHLDGFYAHPGPDCRWCKEIPKTYLFNVQETIEVEARNEEEAYEILNQGSGNSIDRDIMLVEISLLHKKG
jgi:hypothetical protein